MVEGELMYSEKLCSLVDKHVGGPRLLGFKFHHLLVV